MVRNVRIPRKMMLARIFLACLLPIFLFGRDNENNSGATRNSVALEALSRLEGIDLEANPGVKAAVLRVLERTRGTPDFVDIVKKFKLQGQGPGLLEVALENPSSESGVEAMRLVLANGDLALAQNALRST